ncbi:hypothetical protein K0M31_004506 [Melipona bicolor]|uniref:Uncharacterized protein n=1 Tax=Melipona bicolor TaxID=60889 RepID=A0AA40FXN5_9HYME|nr:hypothetical protein K0M31_004506 [Melipona bicolor]
MFKLSGTLFSHLQIHGTNYLPISLPFHHSEGKNGSEKWEGRRRTIVLPNLNPKFSRVCFNCGFDRIFEEPARTSVRSANQRKQICGQSKKLRSTIIVTISSFSSGSPGLRKPDIPHPGHVCAAEFIREPSHAIGPPLSIIYLGNYSEAGSTPVAREPQIIERQALAVSPTTPPSPALDR